MGWRGLTSVKCLQTLVFVEDGSWDTEMSFINPAHSGIPEYPRPKRPWNPVRWNELYQRELTREVWTQSAARCLCLLTPTHSVHLRCSAPETDSTCFPPISTLTRSALGDTSKKKWKQLTGCWQSSVRTADMAENPQNDRQYQRQSLCRMVPVHLRGWCERREHVQLSDGNAGRSVSLASQLRTGWEEPGSTDSPSLSLPLPASLLLSLPPIKRWCKDRDTSRLVLPENRTHLSLKLSLLLIEPPKQNKHNLHMQVRRGAGAPAGVRGSDALKWFPLSSTESLSVVLNLLQSVCISSSVNVHSFLIARQCPPPSLCGTHAFTFSPRNKSYLETYNLTISTYK